MRLLFPLFFPKPPMFHFIVLLLLVFLFPGLLVIAMLDSMRTTPIKKDDEVVPAEAEEQNLTPPPFKRIILPPAELGQLQPSQNRQLPQQMEFAESNVPASVLEFQAVILAGYGNALTPLTNDQGENANPKCLLPIANKPMVTFPLSWLEEAGVTNVLLICPHSHRSAIAHHIHSDISSSCYSTLRVDIQTYEDDNTSTLGTCSILRRFASRIQNDFIILPCDFVSPPSLSLSTILNRYRVNAKEMVISCLFYEVSLEPDFLSFGESIGTPLIAYDDSGTLLYVDYNEEGYDEELELRMRLLWKYPKIRLSSRFADSHVYVCRRSVLSVIAQKPTFESIREDLIPFLCKLQYRKGKGFRWGPVLDENSNLPVQPHATSSWRSTTTSRASSRPASPVHMDKQEASTFGLRCGVEIYPLSKGLAARTNTVKAYFEMNRIFLRQGSAYITSHAPTLEYTNENAQISTDTIIGSSTRISERTNIKQSIVGAHCVIGRQVRISGSVIMDHVVIEDGAKIDGCILGRGTRVGAKAELTKSITQPGYEVDGGASIKGEKLDIADWNPHATGDA